MFLLNSKKKHFEILKFSRYFPKFWIFLRNFACFLQNFDEFVNDFNKSSGISWNFQDIFQNFECFMNSKRLVYFFIHLFSRCPTTITAMGILYQSSPKIHGISRRRTSRRKSSPSPKKHSNSPRSFWFHQRNRKK